MIGAPLYYHVPPRQAPPQETIGFKPVPGQLVFAAALLIAVLVAVGWYVIAQQCKKCDD